MLVAEYSNSISEGNWFRVQNFLINAITIIGDDADLGDDDRLGLILFSSQSQIAISLESSLSKVDLVQVVGELSQDDSGFDDDALQQALSDATSELRLHSGRDSTVIIFKYSPFSSGNQRSSFRQRLYELMDRQITIIVIGKNIRKNNNKNKLPMPKRLLSIQHFFLFWYFTKM